MVFRRIERWLAPVLAGMRSTGSTAPVTTFLVLLAVQLASRLLARLVQEEHRLEWSSRPLQALGHPAVSDVVRPAIRSTSAQSVVELARQLIVHRPYRGAAWEADWLEQGLGLCAELDELERQGRLSPEEIEVSRRFVDTYLRLRPNPAAGGSPPPT